MVCLNDGDAPPSFKHTCTYESESNQISKHKTQYTQDSETRV